MAPPAERLVACPGCRQKTPYSSSNPWRPFCSQRCRNADLGDWANERFRMPAEAPTDDNPQPPEGH